MLTSFHPISFKDIGKHSFNKFQEHSRIEKHFELFKSSDLDLQVAAYYAIVKKESFLNKTWIKQETLSGTIMFPQNKAGKLYFYR